MEIRKIISSTHRVRGHFAFLGSLGNHDGDGEDNVVKKMNLYFTLPDSRDTLKSFSLFLTVKIISKLNMEHSVEFGRSILKN